MINSRCCPRQGSQCHRIMGMQNCVVRIVELKALGTARQMALRARSIAGHDGCGLAVDAIKSDLQLHWHNCAMLS